MRKTMLDGFKKIKGDFRTTRKTFEFRMVFYELDVLAVYSYN